MQPERDRAGLRARRQAPGPCSDAVTMLAVPEMALGQDELGEDSVTKHCPPPPASSPCRQAGKARQVNWVSLAI